MAKITPALDKLLSDADVSLAKAIEAKEAVYNYIENHYEIDDMWIENIIENNTVWCYGIDFEALEKYLDGKQPLEDDTE